MTPKKITLNRDQIIDLLTCAAAYDRRTIGETDVAAWALAIGDLPFDDAQAAIVAHYSETTDWLMPAHLRQCVKQARETRINARPTPAPDPELTDNTTAYRSQLHANIQHLADSKDPLKALPRPGHGRPPSAEYDRIRGAHRDRLRVESKKVRCPWNACKAAIGSPCVTAAGRILDRPAHDARLVAAGLAEWVEVNGGRRAVVHGQEVA